MRLIKTTPGAATLNDVGRVRHADVAELLAAESGIALETRRITHL